MILGHLPKCSQHFYELSSVVVIRGTKVNQNDGRNLRRTSLPQPFQNPDSALARTPGSAVNAKHRSTSTTSPRLSSRRGSDVQRQTPTPSGLVFIHQANQLPRLTQSLLAYMPASLGSQSQQPPLLSLQSLSTRDMTRAELSTSPFCVSTWIIDFEIKEKSAQRCKADLSQFNATKTRVNAEKNGLRKVFVSPADRNVSTLTSCSNNDGLIHNILELKACNGMESHWQSHISSAKALMQKVLTT